MGFHKNSQFQVQIPNVWGHIQFHATGAGQVNDHNMTLIQSLKSQMEIDSISTLDFAKSNRR